jgi:hypothetical protein
MVSMMSGWERTAILSEQLSDDDPIAVIGDCHLSQLPRIDWLELQKSSPAGWLTRSRRGSGTARTPT